jgi:hypothetical protein
MSRENTTSHNDLNFEQWHAWFVWNEQNLLKISADEYQLTAEERFNITSSVQQFQRGESSEAKSLVRNAQLWLENKADKSYYDALLLFIREENRHAHMLKAFLMQHNIPTIQNHWVDQVFRVLRRNVKLEGSVTILLTAELLSAVYYPALKMSTNSRMLQSICDQIIQDEDQHIAFQSALLRHFHHKNSSLKNIGMRLVWTVLTAGTVVVVWHDHKRVFKASGLGFSDLWRKTFTLFRKAQHMISEKECGQLFPINLQYTRST